MTGIWIGGAILATAAFGWRLAVLIWCLAAASALIRRRRREMLVALLISLMAAAGASRAVPPPQASTPLWVDTATGLKGTVDTPPSYSGRGQSFRLAVTEVEIDDRWRPAAGAICVNGPPLPAAGLGDRVLVTGQPERLMDQSTATRSFLLYRRCDATVFARFLTIDERGAGWRRAFADFRDSLSGVLRRAAPGDAGALLSGLVTGDDHALTQQRQLAFLHTGTTHITAVSGSNVALVVSILATVGIAGGLRRQLVWQLAVVAAVWAYAVLVGGEPPVVRAALVASAAVVSLRFGRRPDFVTLIALAAAAMVLVEPAQIWSLSFQLSFAASLGIVMVLSGRMDEGQLTGVGAALNASLNASLAAQIATLPVLWVVFGQLSLTTLPANLLIIPLVSLAFPLAVLAGFLGLIWEPLAVAFVLPARLSADLVFAVVDRLGGSQRAMATIGESSPLGTLLISTIAVTAILFMSPDARSWFNRLSRRLATASPPHPAEASPRPGDSE